MSEEFQRHWSRGVPVVVTHVQVQGAWDPQYFVAEHEVTLVDCETGKTRRSSVTEFFGSFGKPERRTNIEKAKVSFNPPLSVSPLLTGHMFPRSNRFKPLHSPQSSVLKGSVRQPNYSFKPTLRTTSFAVIRGDSSFGRSSP
jgi:hypothetical protein